MEFKIYGRGGHARVLRDLIEQKGYLFGGNFDDADPELEYIFNVNDKSLLVIGIGNNQLREQISKKVQHLFGTLIHPKADVASSASIGEGTTILSGAVIQPGAKVGKHVIINANVVVDHDAVIGDFVSIYPGTYVGGAAVIKAGITIPANSVIKRDTVLG
ncbi:MAG: hypothetical protein KL787_09810 [Taibaiella sp.]|nr:hypothetical protein [Taibaiella sp.]